MVPGASLMMFKLIAIFIFRGSLNFRPESLLVSRVMSVTLRVDTVYTIKKLAKKENMNETEKMNFIQSKLVLSFCSVPPSSADTPTSLSASQSPLVEPSPDPDPSLLVGGGSGLSRDDVEVGGTPPILSVNLNVHINVLFAVHIHHFVGFGQGSFNVDIGLDKWRGIQLRMYSSIVVYIEDRFFDSNVYALSRWGAAHHGDNNPGVSGHDHLDSHVAVVTHNNAFLLRLCFPVSIWMSDGGRLMTDHVSMYF